MVCVIIAVIDDELDNCRGIALIIERIEGIEQVLIYADPFDGLAGVLKDQPDAVLLDSNIQGIEAVKFAETVKFYASDIEWRPLFMMKSGNDEKFSSDFYHVFRTPVDVNELISIFQRAVVLRKSQSEELRDYIVTNGATLEQADAITFMVRAYGVQQQIQPHGDIKQIYEMCHEKTGLSVEYIPKMIKKVLGSKFKTTSAKIIHDLAYNHAWKGWQNGKKPGEGARANTR